jgi:hypothetical protein
MNELQVIIQKLDILIEIMSSKNTVPGAAKIPEAAKILNVSEMFLRKLRREGKLPGAPMSAKPQSDFIVNIPETRRLILSGELFMSKPKRTPKLAINTK